MRTTRSALVIPSILSVLACNGGEGGMGPGSYLNVAGSWQVMATFDGIPSSFARVDGTITITQPTPPGPDLGGTWSLVATIDNEQIAGNGVIADGQLETNGDVTLVLTEPGDPDSEWTFTGRITGGSATGRHSLDDGSGDPPLTGDWNAQRTSTTVAGRSAGDHYGAVSLFNRLRSLAPATRQH